MKLGGWKERQNAEKEFARLYEEHHPSLIRFACTLLRTAGLSQAVEGRAEVAVQEMFITAWENWGEVMSRKPPAGWFYNAIRFKVKEIYREEYRWKKLLRRCEETFIDPAEEHISLNTEFAGIVTKEELDLLYRIYWDGYSYKELSEETGLSMSALSMRIHRIKEKIRKAMEE